MSGDSHVHFFEGGRSTISEDTESKLESKSKTIKSTSEIASRKQRTEKPSTKNESLLGTNETPVISNANKELVGVLQLIFGVNRCRLGIDKMILKYFASIIYKCH